MTINEALASPEGKTLEFKRDLSSPKPLLKTLVAFDELPMPELGLEDLDLAAAKTLFQGILLPGMPVEDMRQGVSKIRNHVIARVFKELNLIEQWGSGVRRIFREAQELGLPEPQIIELGLRVRVVVRLAELLPVLEATEKVAVKRPELRLESRPESRLESRLESALAAKVLMMLFEAEAGKVQLSRMLGHKSVSGELHKQIKRLLILKFIEMTLPEIPNSRLQKYRLTDLGREQFNKQ